MNKLITALSLAGLIACNSSQTTSTCQDKCDKSCPANYEANWESLSRHNETPEWLKDAKFGIYFHWGVFSVPAFGSEWYPYNMYRQGNNVHKHHLATYGKDFDYHDFVKDFKAEKFDPKAWAALFARSGARFAGGCAMHHDGFSLWDSKANPWNAMDKGPKRDLIGELLAEVKKTNLKTITTFHHARTLQRNANRPEEWASTGKKDAGYDSHFAYDPSLITSTKDPELAKMYGNIPADEFHQYWLDLLKEVIDQYSPDIIWFDSWLNLIPESKRQEMTAYYYNTAKTKGQEVTIGYKQADLPIEVGINDIEQGGKMELSERTWMTDVTISKNSWSYVKGQQYKTADLVLRNMIDVWSKNGVVLLNLSPKADGTIPQEQQDVLTKIGDWMKKYGEAVYDTRPHIIHGFGNAVAGAGHHGGQSASVKYSANDVRFTMSKDKKTLYTFFLGKPKAGDKVSFRLIALHRYAPPTKVKRVTLLGTDIEASYEGELNDCILTIPEAPMDEMATVFKFELE